MCDLSRYNMRTFNQYRSIQVDIGEPEYFWYNTKTKRWLRNDEVSESDNGHLQNYITCRSVKAFNRLLENCPRGVKFRLVSRFFTKYDIVGIGKSKTY